MPNSNFQLDNCVINNELIEKYCPEEWRQRLEVCKAVIRCRKGDQIIREGDSVTGMYFIFSGKVKVVKTGYYGKEQIVRLSKAGDIMGHRGLGHAGTYPISAVALEDCVVTYIDNDIFYDMLLHVPTLTFNLMMFMADELRYAESRERKIAQMSVREKVADTILMLEQTYGSNPKSGEIDIMLSRQDVADIAGTTKEQVSRYLYEFKNDGFIDLDGRCIYIKEPDGLKGIVK